MFAHSLVKTLSVLARINGIDKDLEASGRYLLKPLKINQILNTLREVMEFANAGRDSPHRTERVTGVSSFCQPSVQTHYVQPGLVI